MTYYDKAPAGFPRFVHVLARKWETADEEEGPREFAVESARVRHSWAAKCSRQLYYLVKGEEPAEEADLARSWTFGIGRALHNDWQEALTEYCDREGSDIEHEVVCYIPEVPSAGHIDSVITEYTEQGTQPWKKIAVELKTINGTGYEFAIGAKREPRGPRWSAVVQGAVNAYAIGADELVLPYVPLESISKTQAAKKGIPDLLRCGAEWTLTKDQFTPIAEQEIERWRWIVQNVDDPSSPPVPRWIWDPELPERSIVTDPSRGHTMSQDGVGGRTWMCDYCDFRDRCLRDG